MSPLDVNVSKLIEQIDVDLPGASPLAKVTEAQQRARLLGEVGDQLIDHFVAAARASGGSWTHVGDALGVSKQAAQQRWVPSIFQRFTDRSRHVIVLAQERARSLRHDSVGSEHLLLALADADGMAGQILADRAVTIETIEHALGAALTPGTQSPPTHLPFRGDVRDVLHAAPTAAVHLGHDYVGTEHLLLALVMATDPVTAPAIAAMHLDADDVRAEITHRTPALHPQQP